MESKKVSRVYVYPPLVLLARVVKRVSVKARRRRLNQLKSGREEETINEISDTI